MFGRQDYDRVGMRERRPILTRGSLRSKSRLLTAASVTANMLAVSGMDSNAGVMGLAGCTSACPLRPGFGVSTLAGTLPFMTTLESS